MADTSAPTPKTPVTLDGKTILVTGSPGFIGANLVLRLLREMGSGTVVSLDSMSDYYDPALKEYRLSLIDKAAKESAAGHVFVRGSIADKALVEHGLRDVAVEERHAADAEGTEPEGQLKERFVPPVAADLV